MATESALIQSLLSRFKSDHPEAAALADDRVFDYAILKLVYMPKASYADLEVQVTDGANDGGIDFLFFDEDDNKLIIAQCKFTTDLAKRAIIDEFNTIENTLEKFRKSATGQYNHKLKYALQNAIDRFEAGNEIIEYVLFTTANINSEEVLNEFESRDQSPFSTDNVTLYDISNIEEIIDHLAETVDRVDGKFKLDIDSPNNCLEFAAPSHNNSEGILVNVSSKSIQQMYNKFINHGLLDMNIRQFINNKAVDTGIKHSLANERDVFWFLNNGITIACENFYLDGNNVKISNFSVINGGQTTTLIGKDKSANQSEFYIPCKIISYNHQDQNNFFLKIAQATNSQKPIQLRDLNSNSPEMKHLADWLEKDYKIFLEIKRGQKKKHNSYTHTIRNDELGQLILSMVRQQPGAARTSKANIFGNKDFYNNIFRVKYERDNKKKQYIADLVDLNNRFSTLSKELQKVDNTKVNSDQKVVLANGKLCILAIFQVLSHIANNADILTDPDIKNNCQLITGLEFPYNTLISHYQDDDIDEKIEQLIIMISATLAEIYVTKLNDKTITSASNLFKTEKNYYGLILSKFFTLFSFPSGKDILSVSKELFKVEHSNN